jgi:hypothetical protein
MNNYTHTQYTSILRGNPNRQKTTKLFLLYVLKNYIHWKHQLPLFSSCNWKEDPTHSFSGYNLREAPTPQFSGYNQKEATTPYVFWLQPEGGYKHLSLPRPTTLMYN